MEQRVENITQLSDRDIIWQGAKEISLNHPLLGNGQEHFIRFFHSKKDLLIKEMADGIMIFADIF